MKKGKDITTNTSKCGGVLQVWQCLIQKKVKIWPKILDYIFIGYVSNSRAHRFLIYKSSIEDMHSNIIMKLKNVIFFKDMFPLNKG